MKRLMVPAAYVLMFSAALSHTVAAAVTGVLLLFVGLLLLKEPVVRTLEAPTVLLAAMVLWSLVTVLAWGLPLKPLGKYVYYIPILLGPVFAVAGEVRRQRLFSAFALTCVCVVAVSIVQGTFPGVVPFDYELVAEGRLRGTSGHPITAAALYSAAALVSVSLIYFGGLKRAEKAFYAVSAAVLLLGIMLTRARSFYIAFPLALLAMVLHTRDRRLVLTAIAAGAAAAAYAVYNEEILKRALTIFDTRSLQSNLERLAMWRVSWEVMTESVGNFLFGVGYGGWKLKAAGYFEQYYPALKEAALHRHVHNIYLQTMVETGAVGLLLYLSFICSIVVRLVKIISGLPRDTFGRAFAYGMLISVVCYLVGGLFDHLHMPGILVPLYMLLAMAAPTPAVIADEKRFAGKIMI